tara:strand:- start:187 stop:522 length:336 start_codon:yes stop_codon:yes gene_type:complete
MPKKKKKPTKKQLYALVERLKKDKDRLANQNEELHLENKGLKEKLEPFRKVAAKIISGECVDRVGVLVMWMPKCGGEWAQAETEVADWLALVKKGDWVVVKSTWKLMEGKE